MRQEIYTLVDRSILGPLEAHLRAALGITNQAVPWPRWVHPHCSPTRVLAREFSV